MCYDFRLAQGKTKTIYEPQREREKESMGGKYQLDIDKNGSCKLSYITANRHMQQQTA